ncbi:MAG TPA: sensor histidine kinase KdpD [Acidimicrobiia bacterium]|nr:sensor histidine kinase KdpD [Acidimicrobiia bacterium]
MARGKMRVYLGAAPGVGKTYAMLNEGWRGLHRGKDIVVGYVETHGRANTEAQVRDLEVVPRKKVSYRGREFEEMDVDGILARKPQLALIDEIAHTNVPGSRNEKRWQDVEELLDAGIDVVTTLNMQHLESVNDVVERITGIKQHETIPDAVVRSAEQVELVDMTPEALRRRMAHGNIYPAERIDASLANYFRPGNLAALRELALLWVVDKVDESLQDYMEAHGIQGPWETRERVVVALTGAPAGAALIRRAARMAMRAHAELFGVHVRSTDGLAGPSKQLLDEHRALLNEVGGTYHEIVGDDIGKALIEFARAENATQIVLGASRRSRWAELTRGSVINRVIRASGPIDVHVISNEEPEPRTPFTRPRGRRSLPVRRQLAGAILGIVLLPLLTLVMAPLRDSLELPGALLLYLFAVVVIAAIGGVWPALGASVAAFLLVNWFFIPPIHQFTIHEGKDLIALVVFLVTAGVVSGFVQIAARRSAEAARARAEAETLARLGAQLMAEEDPLPLLIGTLRTTFGLQAIAVLRHSGDGWTVETSTGTPVPQSPEDADLSIAIDSEMQLVVIGRDLAAEDLALLQAFTGQLALALERRQLRAEAAVAAGLAEANDLRAALLAAVSHDLRTPLASIKAAATSLLQQDVEWTPQATHELLATIDEETDRLNTLVGNLLDMSRLQSGALQLVMRDVGLEEVVPAAIKGLADRAQRVEVRVDETLPRVHADAALLERAVANIVDNALNWSPPEHPVRVDACVVGEHVDLRVVDRGPGIPPNQRDRMFQPFQRLGDQSNDGGTGLGLAVARGFVDAMGGEITVEDTPGGGLTVIVSLDLAA